MSYSVVCGAAQKRYTKHCGIHENAKSGWSQIVVNRVCIHSPGFTQHCTIYRHGSLWAFFLFFLIIIFFKSTMSNVLMIFISCIETQYLRELFPNYFMYAYMIFATPNHLQELSNWLNRICCFCEKCCR